MSRFHNLDFKKLADGSIRLTQQDGCGDSYIIDLHPEQLRHLAQVFGVASLDYAANELTRRLAEQLGTISKELADEYHRSHQLGLTYAKLDGFMVALPDSIFPFHLWDDEPEKPAALEKPLKQPATSAANAAPSKTEATDGAGQMGLDV